MNEPEVIVHQPTGLRSKSEQFTWALLLGVCFLAVSFLPDPRPLSAPEPAVRAVRAVGGLSDHSARLVATVIFRGAGLALLGFLVSMTLSAVRPKAALAISLVAAPALAIVSLGLNLGYFPIPLQIQVAVLSAIIGALVGLAMRGRWLPAVALVLLLIGLFAWGIPKGIDDDLDRSARATAFHILEHRDEIPDGDDGLVATMRLAFQFAEDNSHGVDPTRLNKAAVLALGCVLGDKRVATVAGRVVGEERREDYAKLRGRLTLRGRNDLVRHFWVSAALTLLSDEGRSMAVGLSKELMDAGPDGSGFSFVDLTADRAGVLFSLHATANEESAVLTQHRLAHGGAIAVDEFMPPIDGLPEGMTAEEFQVEFGGLGGERTRQIVQDIRQRLDGCVLLQRAR